jgi:hypothetical protein
MILCGTVQALRSVALQDVKVESSLGSIGILNVPRCALCSVFDSTAVCFNAVLSHKSMASQTVVVTPPDQDATPAGFAAP